MKIKPTFLASASLAGLSFLSGHVFAQEVTTEATAETPAPTAEAAAPAPEETPAPAAEPEPAPEPEPVVEEPTAVAPVEVPAEEVEEEPGGASLFVFADAWMGWQSAKSGSTLTDMDGNFAGRSGGGVYAFNGPSGTAESGFGLNWLGADLGYDGGVWAVTGSLRFGDAVATYGTGTLGPITNAYLTLRPVEGLSVDVGTFTTIYGAEVAESWVNLNYTRGELYYNFQPFWHTGIRMAYEANGFVGRVLVANDANKSNLGRGAINAGLQLGYSNDYFGIVAGALQSLKPDTTVNNGGFIDTFVDVVATVNAGDFSLVGNFDLNVGYEAGDFWGASLAAGYSFVPAFGMALRGEYLAFTGDADLWTGTLTFDVKPIPDVENVVVRWDNRIEVANSEVYLNTAGDETTKVWFGTVLGLVAYADLL
jgi:hypothetical protein